MRDAKICAQFADLPTEALRVHGTAFLVDVHAVGLVAENENFSAQFAQHAGSGFVSGAMRAIDHDAQAFQSEAAWDGRFHELDVATEGVVNANGLANFAGGGTNGLDVS